jgi:hypothetical protein
MVGMFYEISRKSWKAKPRLTKRAPDVWDSAAFSGFFLASSFPCSQTESAPAHTQVTQTVGRFLAKVYGVFMKADSKSIEARLILISRNTFIFSIVLFAIAFVVGMAQGTRWLIVGLLVTGVLLIYVNLMAPGALIILGYPSLAYAWLHGVNPIVFSIPSWELLPLEKRKSVYIYSIFTLFVLIFSIVRLISENW